MGNEEESGEGRGGGRYRTEKNIKDMRMIMMMTKIISIKLVKIEMKTNTKF